MSRKRKKRPPLRNEFTDALDVELAERKIIERTKPTPPNPEVVEIATVETEKISSAKVTSETVASEIPAPKIEQPPVEEVPAPVKQDDFTWTPIVEIKTDPELETRILREANNTFLDEKPKSESSHKSIFRSKGMQRWEAEQREEESPPVKVESEPKIEPPRKLSRPEKFGVLVSVVMLIYAFVNFDKPLFFLAMSLFTNFLRRPIGSMFGKHSDAVQNALHTFSVVVFFGAVLFLFI